MKIVIAPDSFKGSLHASEAASIIKKALIEEIPNVETILLPMADGGEGTLDAMLAASNGTEIVTNTYGPLLEMQQSHYGIIETSQTAVIEAAQTAGLTLVPAAKRNPLLTSTYGIGEQILHALDKGIRTFTIGLGGTATNDGGLGMLAALGARFKNEKGKLVAPTGQGMLQTAKVDFAHLDKRIDECEFSIATDVDNPLCGENGASFVFGGQKGASNEEQLMLDHGLHNYANLIEESIGHAFQTRAGAGAAGGLGFAFLAIGGALQRGAELVGNTLRLDEALQGAQWVITGEGKSDHQTLSGKVPFYVAQCAKQYGVRALLISGSLAEHSEAMYEAFGSMHSIMAAPMTEDEAMENAAVLLYHKVRNVARLIG